MLSGARRRADAGFCASLCDAGTRPAAPRRARIDNLAGYDFLVSETNCDAIAKNDLVSVFVAKAGDGTRDLIFECDPAVDAPLPAFAVEDAGFVVAMPFVGEILHQERTWRGAPIRYRIRKVEFPHPSDVVGR